MNPTPDPITRALIIDAATREAHWMLLSFVALAIALLFFLLWMRQVVDAIERWPADCLRARVARALRADTLRKYL